MKDYSDIVEWLKSYQQMQKRLIYIDTVLSKEQNSTSYESPDFIRLMGERNSLREEMMLIEQTIHAIEGISYKYALKYRYLEALPISEIQEIMGYSARHIERLLRKGIESIKVGT